MIYLTGRIHMYIQCIIVTDCQNIIYQISNLGKTHKHACSLYRPTYLGIIISLCLLDADRFLFPSTPETGYHITNPPANTEKEARGKKKKKINEYSLERLVEFNDLNLLGRSLNLLAMPIRLKLLPAPLATCPGIVRAGSGSQSRAIIVPELRLP